MESILLEVEMLNIRSSNLGAVRVRQADCQRVCGEQVADYRCAHLVPRQTTRVPRSIRIGKKSWMPHGVPLDPATRIAE